MPDIERSSVNRRSIGYYGVPGEANTGLVHLHDPAKGGPSCGARLNPEARFQWCSWTTVEYIECRTCRKIAARLIAAAPCVPNVARALNAS